MTARDRAHAAGRAVFGADWSATVEADAPGRVELLGNHVDDNGGRVLAGAIDRRVACIIDERGGATLQVAFADRPPISVGALTVGDFADWRSPGAAPEPIDYVRGVLATASVRGLKIRSGARLAVAGDVPIGFGLSSSAALCVALTLALHRTAPSGPDLVLLAQEAEHRAGTPCGTMDQSASVAGHVILYNAAPLGWIELKPDLGNLVFAVADSGVSRSLAVSSYPARVKESAQALALVRSELGVAADSLAAVTPAQLRQVEQSDDRVFPAVLKRRVRHVVTEAGRVAIGVDALRASDWATFGRLMNEFGESSTHDSEVSH
ncbi:MAG: galactokinase, partial [Thermomicrobiales bacterium]